jgi:hypothetical protein
MEVLKKITEQEEYNPLNKHIFRRAREFNVILISLKILKYKPAQLGRSTTCVFQPK